jgi:ribosomal 50S subunit-recycling heat shock protein
MRADLFLHTVGLARSRSHAASLIRGGVTIYGKKIKKPSEDVAENTPSSAVHIENPSKYVSRGGVKLEGALTVFSPDIKEKTALTLAHPQADLPTAFYKTVSLMFTPLMLGMDSLTLPLLATPA